MPATRRHDTVDPMATIDYYNLGVASTVCYSKARLQWLLLLSFAWLSSPTVVHLNSCHADGLVYSEVRLEAFIPRAYVHPKKARHAIKARQRARDEPLERRLEWRQCYGYTWERCFRCTVRHDHGLSPAASGHRYLRQGKYI
ncbi:hypothetical protein Ae201684_017812 [Aphanomyces euteiches]|uniref:Uncharacterized protein n=1 Tax=Aphanomyces euteiches TaxID=100861 RepID=A0A6G0W9I5_9STRA|nr:hypothetical protein Ae201684_017812 [Aphanomyces euteiches]